MGAHKYLEELQKKKQSDVMRFLLRVRCWELRQLNVIHRASRPSRPDKARRLGYKAKQGYVIYRVRVRRGGRKRPVPKGATYGKPTNQGVNQLKYQRSLKSTAEERVGRRAANLRVLNSYWINQDSTYKYYEVILVDPQHKAIRRDPRINWIVNPVHKHRESRGLTATGKRSRGLNKGHRYNNTKAGRRHTWKRQNTLSLWRYSRLLSTGSSSSSSSNNNNNNNSSSSSNSTPPRTNTGSKALPRAPPPALFDPPPTLHGERPQASPTRPQTSGGARHVHKRSVSGPLPKIFGRKKSARDLNGINDSDVPFDDDLVPVLDESKPPAPTRVISGKKGGFEEGERIARRCICCDSKVLVPKELDKFRCVACLTVVDLKPLVEQREEKQRPPGKRLDTFAGETPPAIRIVPLSVERTRAIIDRCLITYLQSRCRRLEQQSSSQPKPVPGLDRTAQSSGNADAASPTKFAMPIRPKADPVGRQLSDAPVSSSPPDTPDAELEALKHTATIKDFTGIDDFSYRRIETPPPTHKPGANGHGPPDAAVPRKSVPTKPTRKPPPPPMSLPRRQTQQSLHPNGKMTSNGPTSPRGPHSPRPTQSEMRERQRYERVKTIFKPLEDYMNASFGDYQALNTAFSTARPTRPGRARSESSIKTSPVEPADGLISSTFDGLQEVDAKTLLLGDLGENSSWWLGKLDRIRSDKVKRKKVGEGSAKAVSSRSPNIDWGELSRWYDLVHFAGSDWKSKIDSALLNQPELSRAQFETEANVQSIHEDIAEAREHAVRALLKITENVLKRPSRPLTDPEHLRFLLIILANPSLYPSARKPKRHPSDAGLLHSCRTTSSHRTGVGNPPTDSKQLSPRKSPDRAGPQHAGLLKRIFGLLANTSDACHRYVTGWFARYDQDRFEHLVDLTASFVTYRISRASTGRNRSKSAVTDGGLIPDLSGTAANTSAQLHSAMGLSGSVKKQQDEAGDETQWANDWQAKAGARVMSLLFAANNIWQGRRRDADPLPSDSDMAVMTAPAHHARAKRSGQLMHTSQFYNMLLDYHDMIADFKVWESKRDKFAFCQYPLFISMGAKIKILEYDAHRQMQLKARDAWFDSVVRQSATLDSYFHLRVRRDCIVDDSLKQISAAVGAGQDELKKGLRVHFTGEEGVDAGGPRKEWFLMLVRDIFDPNHGMFIYDEESHACYFNPNSFETSDQYHLVGVLLGLAIYNSTILDVALPPFAFRKLLASAPSSAGGSANVSSVTGTKGQMTYTIADLAEFRPSLAAGLQQLLDFDGDVQETYCRDFVASVERYGTITNVPLIPNGEGTPVTNANRHEFVDAYIRYILDSSVARQFEPFKRGFFTVCAGNALSLFRAEEIELLIRGSDESLDVDSLRAVAVYENWRHFHPPHQMLASPAETVPPIIWFWEVFAEASPERQRKLLTFITGSDRIPAVGATSLVLRIVAGGDGWGGGGKEERERFPVARTCFNMLVLWRYESKDHLEAKLWRAVEESEGFGLK
ncbi:Domain Homologous to E6-AP Carboxyl Terminus with [Teratosphaeria destructans]|uniref:Ribosomal protein L15 n=1 Tax=Teratosphaeria destructans TaxID=418781 RepID=A0A9W7SP17_9PEZI|nr:Domain Homologous to E6-AP Carboxyl Terminus with [Teratosphaeria destructans]